MPPTVRMMKKINGFQHVCSWDTTKSKNDPATTTWIRPCPWRFFNAPGMAFEKHRILKMDGKRVSYTSSIFASACQVASKSGIFIYCNCSSNSNHLKCVVPETSLPTARQIEIPEANHSKTTFIYPYLKVVYGSH